MKFIHVSAGAPHGLIHRPAVSHCHWYTSTRRGSPLAPYLRLRDTANSVLAAAIVLVSFVFWRLIELYFVAPLREVDAFVPAAVREELRGGTLQAPLPMCGPTAQQGTAIQRSTLRHQAVQHQSAFLCRFSSRGRLRVTWC
ncbi:hypothetical protein Q4I32_001724 [Leishmania shawi]|uniref:Uncharacterized protein n=1 Tax=Leishmania shawi TaxID=5680 RepID=A0AAW3C7R5_9TRYP